MVHESVRNEIGGRYSKELAAYVNYFSASVASSFTSRCFVIYSYANATEPTKIHNDHVYVKRVKGFVNLKYQAETRSAADMPADIRNFFGGRPGATAPKQETPLGTKNNVCAPFSCVILCGGTAGLVPGIQCVQTTLGSSINYVILISILDIFFEWREHANYSSYYSLEPATSVEVVRSYLLDYLPFLTMNRRSYNSR
jgi:hypothetical protein